VYWHSMTMTAPFAADICGYRAGGSPSTSDAHDSGSVEWGHALFDALGIDPNKAEIPQVGLVMEQAAAAHLSVTRPDLVTRLSRSAREFAQYRHLDVFRHFAGRYTGPGADLTLAYEALDALPHTSLVETALRRLLAAQSAARVDHDLVTQLVDTMPEESLLKIDVTVGAPSPNERLLVALSSKWSLRTDRAQDCVSQGSKLVSLRRGHMPHYAVLTMEPRPAMLRLIAYSSGAVDCVYHVALPELRSAARVLANRKGGTSWPQRASLERMVAQGRIRAYGDLVDEVKRLPSWE